MREKLRTPKTQPGPLLATCACFLGACAESPPETVATEPIFAKYVELKQVLVMEAGETLGDLLIGIVPSAEWGDALLAFRDVANPRRIRTGSRVTVRTASGSAAPSSVEVALNPDESVRLLRSRSGGDAGTWRGELVAHPLIVDTVSVGGTIDTNLWNAVVDAPGLDATRAGDRSRFIHALDQVFQWQIDFSVQIRTGDGFRFVAERAVLPDGSTRSVRILAAEIVNAGSPYTAVWFDPNQDGDGSYFDQEGESVRRAFLLRPLEYRRISSRFSPSRFHPILKTWRAHRGVDYAADRGTPVMATGSGVVASAGTNGGLGTAVEIRHPSGFTTRYGHLSGIARGVSAGAPVAQGQVVGYVGMTGLATAPHLHYEMTRGGRHIDPLSVDLPADDPVPEDSRELWTQQRDGRLALLGSVRIPDEGAQVVADQGSG